MQPTQRRTPAPPTRISPTAAFLAALALVLVGLLAPGIVGAALLLTLAGGLVWLMTRSWPLQPVGGKLFRLVVLALLIAAALAKIL